MRKLLDRTNLALRKLDDKGFSLVELIVVIAIMAVLVAVLAPQYIKYVEKSRSQKDESAVAEVVHSVEIAIADEKVYDAITATTTLTVTDKKITLDTNNYYVNPNTVTGTNALIEELASLINAPDLVSKTYAAKSYTITITLTGNALSVAPYASGNWS